jgi:hypothetical protein
MNSVTNRCPVCRTSLWAPKGEQLGKLRCPRCAAELCFIRFSSGPAFFVCQPGQTVYDVLAELVTKDLGLYPEMIEAGFKNADSLDQVEFIMEIEEAACRYRPPEPE